MKLRNWVIALCFVLYLALEVAAAEPDRFEWIPSQVIDHRSIALLAVLVILAESVHAIQHEVRSELAILKTQIEDAQNIGKTIRNNVADAAQLVKHLAEIESRVKNLSDGFEEAQTLLPGRVLFYEGEFEKAVEIFKTVCEKSPRPTNYRWLGLTLMKLRRPADSIPSLLVAAQLEDSEVYEALGEAYLQMSNGLEAEAWLRKALIAQPYNEKASVELGRALALRDRTAALEMFDFVLRRNPKCGPAAASRIGLLLSEQRYDDALASCDDFLSINHTDMNIRRLRATVLLMRGSGNDHARADLELTELAESNPQDFKVPITHANFLIRKALSPESRMSAQGSSQTP